MDGRKTLITAGDAAFSFLFNVPQEGTQQVSIDVGDEQLVHFLMCLRSSEDHEQPDCVAIALLRIASQIPLADEVLHQEAPDPRTQGRAIIHGGLLPRSPGSGDWLPSATPASLSGNTGSSKDRHVRDRWKEPAGVPVRRHRSCTTPSTCGRRTCACYPELGIVAKLVNAWPSTARGLEPCRFQQGPEH